MPENIPALGEYLKTVASSQHATLMAMPGARVKDAVASAAMKSHILKLYQGIESKHSFVDDNGSIFDCIPVNQQPSLRGAAPAKAPNLPAMERKPGVVARTATGDRHPVEITSQFAAQKDKYGNQMSCPEGCIPMRRITLEEIARFTNLEHFFQKSPEGEGVPAAAPNSSAAAIVAPQGPSVAATHRWAHAYQTVNNLGGHSYINVWDPSIGNNQIFSLSQHWYVAGSGSGLQTAEVGWQVYPQKYNTSKPVFFIYWTADNYSKTGCYNLDCSAFVQTNHNWTIGGTLSPWSTYGGAQYEIQVTFYLYQGNWWLYVGGTDAAHAIGYYPTSIYKGGAMSHHAASIDYGGETVGTTSFPGMGSGHFANQGWTKACYQRDVYYFPTSCGAVFANLNPSQSWPACYTVQKVNYAAPWYDTIYYGGPGGNC
jgi:hypothetical protein